MTKSIERTCPICKSDFCVAYPSKRKTFCSRKCSMKDTASKRDYRGAKNPKWRGGRVVEKSTGRVYIYAPEHPNATKLGYVYEYRLAMEDKLGRILNSDEIVHHAGVAPSVSDPSSLSVMTQAQHAALEAELKYRDPLTGFRKSGVGFVKRNSKWRARGHRNGKPVHLGEFESEVEARAAVQAFWATRPVLQEIFKP